METSCSVVHHRLFSFAFAHAYLTTMRPYLLFVSGITGLIGLSLIPGLPIVHVISVVSASFLSYGFGQALTDCFQVDTDSISAPYRPLTQGIVGKKQVFLVSIIGLTCCISVFTFYRPLNLVLGFAAGFGLATYTTFKKKWWAGPFYNAWIVVVLCLMAFLTGNNSTMTPQLLWTLAAVFFGYANFVLAGYFKDIRADRATGYYTLPVVCGRLVAVFASDVLALLFVVCALALLCLPGGDSTRASTVATCIFSVGGIRTSLIAQVRLHTTSRDDEAHAAISAVVHSYILLLSAVACHEKPEGWICLATFYAAFAVLLKFRPAKNQI